MVNYISIICIIFGISSLIYNGGPSLSIDFTGGNIAQLSLDEAIDISEIRSALFNNGLASSEIIEFGSPKEILIKTQYDGNSNDLINIL